MIVKLNPKTKSEDIERLIKEVEDLGVSAYLIEGFEKSVIGLVGDTTLIDEKKLEGNKIVEKITKVIQLMTQVGSHIVEHFQTGYKLSHSTFVDKVGCCGCKYLGGKHGRVSYCDAQKPQHKSTVKE